MKMKNAKAQWCFETDPSNQVLNNYFTASVGLSKAEARLVMALFSSKGLSGACSILGIAYETARKQLKAISMKTEVFLGRPDIPIRFMRLRWMKAIYTNSGFKQEYLLQLCEYVLERVRNQELANALAETFAVSFQDIELQHIQVAEKIEDRQFAVFASLTGISPVRMRKCREEEVLTCIARYLPRKRSFKLTGHAGFREVQSIEEAARVLPSLTAPARRGVLVAEFYNGGWVPILRIHFIPPSKT